MVRGGDEFNVLPLIEHDYGCSSCEAEADSRCVLVSAAEPSDQAPAVSTRLLGTNYAAKMKLPLLR